LVTFREFTNGDVTMQDPPLTVGTVAEHFRVPPWMIRRLFERGLLPPAPRVGAYRVIAAADLPLVERALRVAGYLPRETAVRDPECAPADDRVPN
jgi:hypothetical protein